MFGKSAGDRPPLVVVCGPTAAGKTALALDLAETYGMEIVSADSRQVYRGMDIGTAKATLDERRRVPHHLIDVVRPDENFTAADFTKQARQCIADIAARGKRPLVAGGTGLYIRTLTEGLAPGPPADPGLRRRLHELEAREGEGALHRRLAEVDSPMAASLFPRDRVRIVRALEVHALTGRRLSDLQREHRFGAPRYRLLKLGLTLDRKQLYERINRRVEVMFASGLLDEVAGLLRQGYPPSAKAFKTIGYRECLQVLQGRLSKDEAIIRIQRDTRRYAKRQLTWFGRDESIIWVDSLNYSATIHALIDNFYAQ